MTPAAWASPECDQHMDMVGHQYIRMNLSPCPAGMLPQPIEIESIVLSGQGLGTASVEFPGEVEFEIAVSHRRILRWPRPRDCSPGSKAPGWARCRIGREKQPAGRVADDPDHLAPEPRTGQLGDCHGPPIDGLRGGARPDERRQLRVVDEVGNDAIVSNAVYLGSGVIAGFGAAGRAGVADGRA